MLNTAQVFERLQLGTSPMTAVAAIRDRIDNASVKSTEAEKIIFEILGVEVHYENEDKARLVAKAVGEEAWKANHNIDDAELFLRKCETRIDGFMNNPRNAFHFVKPEYAAVQGEMKQVVEGIDVQVQVKEDGSIKKGGRQILALELYKKHVLESKTPVTNQQFIAILVKDLDMSKAGATTYAYNCKKELGEPEGGIVKSKRGRKPAAK